MSDVIQPAAGLRLMIFDVDGVLTDGGLHYGPEGELFKTFNALDGHGIKLLARHGIQSAIITARSSAIVSKRGADLGINYLLQGVRDKKVAFFSLLQQTGFGPEQCGFVGDDLIDLPVLTRVGFSASTPHGHPEVRKRVHYLSHALAGAGAVREICDHILRAQGCYDEVLANYLQ